MFLVFWGRVGLSNIRKLYTSKDGSGGVLCRRFDDRRFVRYVTEVGEVRRESVTPGLYSPRCYKKYRVGNFKTEVGTRDQVG